MGAFDPLFRNRSPRFGRRPAPRRGGGRLGALGLAGLGYGLYRFLKTERGQEMQQMVIERVREFGSRVGSASGQLRTKLGDKTDGVRTSIPEMSQL